MDVQALSDTRQESSGPSDPPSGRPSTADLLFRPNISLNGRVSEEATLPFFLGRLLAIRDAGEDLIPELNTTGGDADTAARIALEIGLFLRVEKTVVYSAGVTILAAFRSRAASSPKTWCSSSTRGSSTRALS
jgi:hypothetical protein